MSNNIVAKVDFWVLASFRACSTFKRAVGKKSEILVSDKVLTLGIYTS